MRLGRHAQVRLARITRGEDYTVQRLRDARILEVFSGIADYVPAKERRRRWLLDRSNTLQVHAAGEIGQCSRDPLGIVLQSRTPPIVLLHDDSKPIGCGSVPTVQLGTTNPGLYPG